MMPLNEHFNLVVPVAKDAAHSSKTLHSRLKIKYCMQRLLNVHLLKVLYCVIIKKET